MNEPENAPCPWKPPHLEAVIVLEVSKGAAIEQDPIRISKRVYTPEGVLIAERDDWERRRNDAILRYLEDIDNQGECSEAMLNSMESFNAGTKFLARVIRKIIRSVPQSKSWEGTTRDLLPRESQTVINPCGRKDV